MDTLPRVEGAGLRGTVRRVLSDTPRRLVLAALGLGALSAALVAVLVAGTMTARGGLSAMASAAGEVSATNDLYFRLNDMDAQAADALLVGFHPTLSVPASVNAQASVSTYESDRQAADRDLQTVAANPALAGASVIADGQAGLGIWQWVPYAAGSALLALIGAALSPRLREYR